MLCLKTISCFLGNWQQPDQYSVFHPPVQFGPMHSNNSQPIRQKQKGLFFFPQTYLMVSLTFLLELMCTVPAPEETPSPSTLPPSNLSHPHLVGEILLLGAEILGHFPAAGGEVQDGSGSHMCSLGIMGIVEACGWRRSALHVTAGGTVTRGRGLWKRFGCKREQHRAWCTMGAKGNGLQVNQSTAVDFRPGSIISDFSLEWDAGLGNSARSKDPLRVKNGKKKIVLFRRINYSNIINTTDRA